MSRVRDAMVAAPLTLDVSATAQEAGERLSDPDVRAVLVSDDGALAGVVTRKTLVREVVAAGRDPASTKLGEIAEPPLFTLDAELENARLVGVLSRSAVQRRLAEDEPPEEVSALEL